MFVTLEGIEGSGKSTQIEMLGTYLEKKNVTVLSTREPGGTRIGKQVRSILMDTDHTELEPMTELFLILADRAQHVNEIIKPALTEGKLVLCDRFADSTLAYQGFGRQLDLNVIQKLNTRAVEKLAPDLTILIDCPVEIGLKRTTLRLEKNKQLRTKQRFEREKYDFHQRVRQGYLWIAKNEPERVIVMDGTLQPSDLHNRITRLFMETTDN